MTSRRQFISLLGGAAVAWPVAAWGQPAAMPVIGFVNAQSSGAFTHLIAAFRRGLSERGYIEGQNVAIEYRWGEGNDSRVPGLIGDLISRRPAVIVIGGSTRGPFAAKAATTAIPIVASIGFDPVKAGLVDSFNRPGGNLTAVSVFTTMLEAKRFYLLRQIVPKGALIGVLFGPARAEADKQRSEVQAAARARDYRVLMVDASTERELDAAFSAFSEARVGAVDVVGHPFFNSKRDELVSLAARHSLPAIFELRQYVEAGGLMSYGTSITEVYRQVGIYTGRILQGEKPADLPVVQPTKFELVINLKTAKALGLDIPPTLLALADEVIE